MIFIIRRVLAKTGRSHWKIKKENRYKGKYKLEKRGKALYIKFLEPKNIILIYYIIIYYRLVLIFSGVKPILGIPNQIIVIRWNNAGIPPARNEQTSTCRGK